MEHSYNMYLVFLSFVIACAGSFTALNLAMRIPTAEKDSVGFWVLSSGIALGGGGIWAMHFIGMLAMDMPFAIQYDITLTAVSFIVAVAFVSLGLAVAGRDLFGSTSLIPGGILAGLGVSCMHYIGMYLMIMPATITYNTFWVSISVVIAIVASCVALWLAYNLRGAIQRFGSAILMGAAVCSMHYTGMYATHMMPENGAPLETSASMSTTEIAGAVSIIAVLIMALMTVMSYYKTKSLRQMVHN